MCDAKLLAPELRHAPCSFVVDAERGIILTNRHVVTTGPVTADAVFANKEEVSLLPRMRCCQFVARAPPRARRDTLCRYR